jgi:hypothetical protein
MAVFCCLCIGGVFFSFLLIDKRNK